MAATRDRRHTSVCDRAVERGVASYTRGSIQQAKIDVVSHSREMSIMVVLAN